MISIEPQPFALLFFAAFWTAVSLGFYVLVGALPLETRPDLRMHRLGIALVGADLFFLLVLTSGSLAYGIGRLRWTSVVIVAGLGLLFAPGIYNVWPTAWRDGPGGLAILLCGFAIALTTLFVMYRVGSF